MDPSATPKNRLLSDDRYVVLDPSYCLAKPSGALCAMLFVIPFGTLGILGVRALCSIIWYASREGGSL
jgi:hypothetical protein